MRKRKFGAVCLSLCLLLSTATVAQAAPVTENQTTQIEVRLYDESGEELEIGKENAEIVADLLEEITGEKGNPVIANRGSCTHIPCQQYEGYLYAHTKVSTTECWVYRMKAVICKCCGGAVKSLSGWEYQYSHKPH